MACRCCAVPNADGLALVDLAVSEDRRGCRLGRRTGSKAAQTAYLLGAGGTAALCIFTLPFHAWFAASAAALAAVLLLTRHCRTRLNGHTGDTIGASQQVGEITFLLTLAMIV